MRLGRRIVNIIFVIWVAAISNPAFAGEYSGQAKITEFYMPATSDYLRIRLDKPLVNPDQCGGTEFYMKELTAGIQDRFVSTVMSAFLAGKTVAFWISGCTAGPYWGATRPVMADIYVYP